MAWTYRCFHDAATRLQIEFNEFAHEHGAVDPVEKNYVEEDGFVRVLHEVHYRGVDDSSVCLDAVGSRVGGYTSL